MEGRREVLRRFILTILRAGRASRYVHGNGTRRMGAVAESSPGRVSTLGKRRGRSACSLL